MNIIKELKKENNKESRKIMLDDLGLIRNITDKMNMFIMNSYDMQIVKRDLIGMAQEMKLRGTTLRDELGDNVDEFTEEIIESSRGPSKLEIFLNLLKTYTLTLIIMLGSIILLSKNINSLTSLYLPIFVGILVLIQTIIAIIFEPVFNLDKSYKKYIPRIIYVIPLFIFLISDLNKLVRYGPTIKKIYLIIFLLIIYLISYLAYNKHIENLAESSDDIVRDLEDKQ